MIVVIGNVAHVSTTLFCPNDAFKNAYISLKCNHMYRIVDTNDVRYI